MLDIEAQGNFLHGKHTDVPGGDTPVSWGTGRGSSAPRTLPELMFVCPYSETTIVSIALS